MTAAEAMVAQNYRVRREVCGTCLRMQSHREVPEWALKLWPGDTARHKKYEVSKGLHCAIGGFSVKPTATCDRYERDPEKELRA
jgi:hypothetical protein